MKQLKTYENFFSDIFKNRRRQSDGKYFWTGPEQIELEAIGFINDSPASSIGSFYYIPILSDNVEKIIIEKNTEILNYQEDFFYDVILNLKNTKNQTIKDFDNFEDVIQYVKQFIPEIDTNIKKYNI